MNGNGSTGLVEPFFYQISGRIGLKRVQMAHECFATRWRYVVALVVKFATGWRYLHCIARVTSPGSDKQILKQNISNVILWNLWTLFVPGQTEEEKRIGSHIDW